MIISCTRLGECPRMNRKRWAELRHSVPSPLAGRDRERGGDQSPSGRLVSYAAPQHESPENCFRQDSDRRQLCACVTPLPVPPPQGGRERCSAALPISSNALA